MEKIEVHPGGRPPIFENPDQLVDKINDYIKSCVPEYMKDNNGEYVTTEKGLVLLKNNKPTVTGLAMFLGFADRQSLYDYEKKQEYSCIIKKARLFVENSYEEDLRNSSLPATGSIFALKNMGWSDKMDINHSGEIDSTVTTREEKRNRIKELLDKKKETN